MNKTDFAKYQAEQKEYNSNQKMVRTHVCSKCGANLKNCWRGEFNKYSLECVKSRNHTGYMTKKSYVVERLETYKENIEDNYNFLTEEQKKEMIRFRYSNRAGK